MKMPEFEPDALRDHGTSARIERVWQRLENDIGERRPRSRAMLVLAPAAALAVFGAGVLVGARWSPAGSAESVATLPAPRISAEPGSAFESKSQAPAGLAAEPRRVKQNVLPQVASVARSLSSGVAPQLNAPRLLQPSLSANGPMEWERLATKAEYAAAFRALDDAGGFEAALSHATAEQAMLLHDVARFSGQRLRAIQALRHVVNEHPGDPYASTAAYTLGNMLENAGDRAGAAEAFGIYRRLAPKGDFVEDALTRQLDVALQQHDVELARRLADQYENEFPNGRRLAEIRKRVAQLSGSADASRESQDEKPSEERAPDQAHQRVPAP